jgi:hypothetical protein
MQYRYRYKTYHKVLGEVEFDDFFHAIQFMNKHTMETFGVLQAEIWNVQDNRLVVSKRSIQ